jgi:hypothetical protein
MSESPSPTTPANGVCPFLDANDPRCAARFSLARLDEMTELCIGGGCKGCAMFHRLQMEAEHGAFEALPSPFSPLMSRHALPKTGS